MYTIISMPKMGRVSSLLEFKATTIALSVLALPLFGFLFSVIWSLLFNFENSTSTHCSVNNYLPSVSAAIGDTPARYVWRICIALQATPRLLITVAYLGWNRNQKMDQTKLLSAYQSSLSSLAAFANAVENFALIFLTYISSLENKPLHEDSFVLFVISSMVYMLTTCFFHSAMINETEKQKKSLKIKKISCIVNISAFFISLYFYFRHNAYCETGVYTLFALCEYIVIVSNMAFHSTVKFDFDDSCMRVEPLESDGKDS